MNLIIRQIFNMLRVEPNEEFKLKDTFTKHTQEYNYYIDDKLELHLAGPHLTVYSIVDILCDRVEIIKIKEETINYKNYIILDTGPAGPQGYKGVYEVGVSLIQKTIKVLEESGLHDGAKSREYWDELDDLENAYKNILQDERQ